MGEITLRSDKPSDKTIAISQEAIKTEGLRVGYALIRFSSDCKTC